jgi:hypothetical protein
MENSTLFWKPYESPSIEFAGVFTSIVNQKSTAPSAFGGQWSPRDSHLPVPRRHPAAGQPPTFADGDYLD